MIIKLEQDSAIPKGELVIKYSKLNKEITRAITTIKSASTKVKCINDTGETFINATDIYYFESVDKSTFVYCEKDVYKTEQRLYQLAENLNKMGFVQISKSVILNIAVLASLAPISNSRMEATLNNGERVCVSRNYLADIRQALEEGILR